MWKTPYDRKLRAARTSTGLTQAEAARRLGLSRGRLSRLENGVMLPSDRERRLFQDKLGLVAKSSGEGSTYREIRLRTKARFPSPQSFTPRGDRPIHLRFRAALERHHSLVALWVARIRARDDGAEVEYWASRLQADSYAEVLFVLRLLEAGAEPLFLPLGRLGWLPVPPVNPKDRSEILHRPLPALLHHNVVYFFQVSFATPEIRRVDVLAWHTTRKAWVVYEIDGAGHRSYEDHERDQALGLPIIRLVPDSICRQAFVDELAAQAARHFQRRGYWP